MGDWGSGPFENDDAADFLDSLESTHDRCALIRRTLRRAAISRSYLELPESASAWVAAELVAALRGAGRAAAKKWMIAIQLHLTRAEIKELAELAAAALARIARDSELLDLFTEAGQTAGFKRRLNDLRRRLSQPSNVKQHRAAASKSRSPGRRPGPG